MEFSFIVVVWVIFLLGLGIFFGGLGLVGGGPWFPFENCACRWGCWHVVVVWGGNLALLKPVGMV